ncbi:hypothetical protein ACO22_03832 [Paracoccidioides brasiliensis]|uniref:Uncharacterized protein n=1 Tax=Paracoccidioides brasiliensis TaxID=121759 RepID=A0A1D2JF11_PARBR|nr:hypothetical protein ACO22_03832 [Paracoccidioides brasiliensis]
MPNATHMETLYVRFARGTSMRVWQPAQPGRNGPGDGKRGGKRPRPGEAATSNDKLGRKQDNANHVASAAGHHAIWRTANGDCEWHPVPEPRP